MIRRLMLLMATVLLAGCAQMSRESVRDVAASLQPIAPVTVTVLNPSLSSDSLLLVNAAARAETRRGGSFQWPPARADRTGRSLRDITDLVDDPGRRAQLAGCVNRGVEQDEVVVVRLQIAENGQVLAGSVTLSTIHEPDVVSCLVQSLLTWDFGTATEEVRFDIPLAVIHTPRAD